MPKVTGKYQVSIPKTIREKTGIRVGDEVEFVIRKNLVLLKKKTRKSLFEKYIGAANRGKEKDTDRIIEDLRGPLS